MAHVADVVDPVHVWLTCFGVEKSAHAPHNLERCVVGNTEVFAQVLLPDGKDLLAGAALIPGSVGFFQAQNHARIRAQGRPHPPLAGPGHPGKIAFLSQKINHQLKMQVGCPPAVFRLGTDGADPLSGADRHARRQPVQGGGRQVAIERVKGNPAVRPVVQDNGGTVILAGIVIP